ncbi:MAG: Hsp70 family protein [Lachnospiraceae bacterium]|nr:Hsp70 family protein [Lachnospiraceae bacterium]
MQKNKVFGIDLGTTYSCVAYVDDFDKASAIKNSEDETTTPSVIYFENEDSQIVGKEAKNYAVMEPENTVSFIKREMGKDYRRKIYGVEYTPQELSAKILTKLVKDANASLREQGVLKPEEPDIKKAVITCPAYFGLAEKDATRAAGEIAGLEVLDIINEPTAAAIHYGVLNGQENKKVMVYDLGGGTFDVTIIEIQGGNAISVVCTGGDPELGGKDWDTALVEYLKERWKTEMNTSEDITDDLETLSSMMDSAENAKKSLSTKEQTPILVNYEGERMKLKLTRDEYDDITRSLLQKTIDLTNRCLEAAAQKRDNPVQLEDIDEILLVGGSSRMPQVQKIMEEVYQKPVSLFDPNEAVAKGAAIYAQKTDLINVITEELARKTNRKVEDVKAQIDKGADVSLMAEEASVSLSSMGETGRLTTMRINNVSSRTYGIKVWDPHREKEFISNFIFQNDPLPRKETKTFYPTATNQNQVDLELYESTGHDEEIRNLENATQITVFAMKFVKRVPMSTEVVITLRLENSGLIYVDAEEMKFHSKLNATYDVKNALSEEEMDEAKDRARRATID